MGATPLIPHVLVELDPDLTLRLYKTRRKAGLVLTPNALLSPFAAAGWDGDPIFFQLHLEALIDVQVRKDRDRAKVACVALLREELAATARDLGLAPGERLRTVVVGDHCSLVDHFRVGTLFPGGDPQAFDYFNGIKRQRKFARLLGRALETLDELDLLWLSAALPGQVPQQPDPHFDALAGRARSDLATLLAAVERSEPRFVLKHASLPLIYMRERMAQAEPGDDDWRPINDFLEGDRPHSTTRALFGQYSEVRRELGDRDFDAVFVKLLLDDHALHNKADPPIVTREQVEAAACEGMMAILLDRHHGIVHPEVSALDAAQCPPIIAA